MNIQFQPIMQRAEGKAHIAFERVAGKQRLQDLHQSGCIKLIMPKVHGAIGDGVVINTAGGLTGGDKIRVSASLGQETEFRLATQTAERIYRSPLSQANVDIQFSLSNKASLDWLPQETILFNGGVVHRKLSVEMEEASSFLCVESVVLGRKAMGEVVKYGTLRDDWRIKRGGKLVFADALRLSDFIATRKRATLGANQAFATILLVEQNAKQRAQAVSSLVNSYDVTGGISAWNGLLLIRLLAPDALALRTKLMKIIEHLRDRPLPRVWTM